MMRIGGWILRAGLPFAALAALAQPAPAYYGLASGHVAIIDTDLRAYGFSSYSGLWTTVALSGTAHVKRIGSYFGYIRNGQKLYCFNATNDHWYSTNYDGWVQGESVNGATLAVYTSTTMYAIASVWSSWRSRPFEIGELPLGGGSAGNFALFWTTARAYAFHSVTGEWQAQLLNGAPVASIVNDGFGLVCTADGAYSFDPATGAWTTLDLGGVLGVSAAGSGSVGVVWNEYRGIAYSGILSEWIPLTGATTILGGGAGGEVAILWDAANAYCFDANGGTWLPVTLQGSGQGAGVQGPGADDRFAVTPNPSSGAVQFELPADGRWKLELFDVNGARLRSWEDIQPGKGGVPSWDGLDAGGRQAAAGSYWVRAESAEGQVEARRFIKLR
jgi:hypothetical protein